MSCRACRKFQWENCHAQVLEQGCAICSRKWYVFCKTAPRVLLGPRHGRVLDHAKPKDHTSGTSHYDLGSVRSTKLRCTQEQASMWWKRCIRTEKMIRTKHTKAVGVSSYDPHSQRTSIRPSANTYVQVENL